MSAAAEMATRMVKQRWLNFFNKDGNVSLLFEVPDPNRPEATDGHHRAPLRTRRPAAH